MTLETLPTDNSVVNTNALKHGILSKHLLLQWEDASEYESLLVALRHDYLPTGTTEGYLVEELAGVIWRKRRLRIAESAYHRSQLQRESDGQTVKAALIYTNTKAAVYEFSAQKALSRGDADNQQELKTIAEYREPAMKVMAMLERGDATYEGALAALADVTRAWWLEDKLGEENSRFKPTAEHLYRFLYYDVMKLYNQQYEEVIHRPLIRQQAEGEALIPGERLEKFSRYEVHLDRKFERTLTVLLRLQEMRRSKVPDPFQDQVA